MSPGQGQRPVAIAAYLGMLVFGVVLTALGSVLPSVIARFGLTKADAGALLSLMSLGILAGSLVFGPVVDRHGYRVPLTCCTALVALGLEGLAFAPGVSLLRASILLIGVAGGVVNGGTNALVADISAGERSAGLSLLGVFFGLGALGVPLLLGLLGGAVPGATVLGTVGALGVLPAVYFAATRFPEPKQAHGFPVAEAARLLREPVLLVLGSLLFLQSGMEITLGGWTAAYLQEVLALPAPRAVLLLSLYWLSLTVARLVLGRALQRVPPAPVLVGSIAVSLLGSAVLLASSSIEGAALGLALLGAGFAAVFPVVLGYLADLFPGLSGTAFSIALVMALSGGMLLPYLTGALGGVLGLRASFAIVPLAACAQAAIFLGLAARRLAQPSS